MQPAPSLPTPRMAAQPTRPWMSGIRFVRALLAALADEKTYDIRRNPSLGLGFVLAIPIPVLTWMGDADLWLQLLSLPAPVVWGALLGAAGRVGMLAQQRSEELAEEMTRVQGAREEAESHLVEEADRRRALEVEKEDIVSELKLAQAIQATLLPPPIQRPNVECVARSIPTRYIGGDYVHCNVIEDRWLYMVLLDVSGHGISAAMVVARLHGMVRRLTLTKQRPLQMLERLNQASQRLLRHTYFFLTAVTARIDLHTGELDYATAGHPAQLLLREDGSVEELRTRNRLLGMDDDIISRVEPSKRAMLQPGDSVVFFSDGLIEVLKDGRGDVLGEDGLRGRIEGLSGVGPSMLIGEVLQELSEYQGSSEFEDDVTMLVARYLGNDPDDDMDGDAGGDAPAG